MPSQDTVFMAVSPFIAVSHTQVESLMGVALARSRDRHVNTETKTSEQVTGSTHSLRG